MSSEGLERKYALQIKGVDLDFIAAKTADLLGMSVEEVWFEEKYKHLVTARSLICFWAVRELGMSTFSLARKFNLFMQNIGKL